MGRLTPNSLKRTDKATNIKTLQQYRLQIGNEYLKELKQPYKNEFMFREIFFKK